MMTPEPSADLAFAAFDSLPPGLEAEIGNFVAQAPATSHSQRPDWIRLCPPAAHHRYVHLTARRRDGGICGYALVRLTPLLAGFTLASMRRGPIAASLDMLAPVLMGFVQSLRPMGVCSLLVNPRYQGAEDTGKVIAALSALGATVLPDAEQSQHQATLLVDLSGSEADLRGRLKQRCRRQISKAEKAGLVVRSVESLEMALEFEPVFREFHARRRLGTDTIPPIAKLYEMTRDKGAFLLGHIGDELVCGHVVIPDTDRAFWMTLASTKTHCEVPKSYPLIFEALRIAQSQGFRWYDMAGAPPLAAVTGGTAAGDAQKRHQFKMGFAPIHVPIVPAMVLPVRQPAHSILFGLRQTVLGIRSRRRMAA